MPDHRLPLPHQSAEIYEDRRFENITQVWLGGDHYKWRLMRAAGVPEKYITGDAGDRKSSRNGRKCWNGRGQPAVPLEPSGA
jgi:glucuronate isomerase